MWDVEGQYLIWIGARWECGMLKVSTIFGWGKELEELNDEGVKTKHRTQ